MLQQYISILEKSGEKDLISFLQSLSDADKKKLVPDLKKLSKQYFEYKQVNLELNSYTYRYKADEKQVRILLIGCFVCMNRSDFEKTSFPGWILDEKYLRDVIDWYCPVWFSDFVNGLVQKNNLFYGINYDWIIELTERRFLLPSKELIVALLPNSIFTQTDRQSYFIPENVLKSPLTLREFIWYLFEVESNLHYCSRWLNMADKETKDEVGWVVLFKRYSEEGKIDRGRLLKESLLASNRNFNKVLSGWFCELFMDLQPTTAELLELQKELCSVLSSPNSKPVNSALQSLKKIIFERDFELQSFLDYAPALLSSDTKNVVIATLGIVEKLAKKNVALKSDICKSIVAVFITANDDVQTRAAKIIVASSAQLDESFQLVLDPYLPTMMTSARKLLQNFYAIDNNNDEGNKATEIISKQPGIATSLPKISLPENIDDLLFLASQAFDNNQPWHIDILPAAIIRWQSALVGENIDKLQPALQRALQITRNELRSGQGSLDYMLAIFFIDVCVMLVRSYPDDSKALDDIFSMFDKKAANNTRFMSLDESVCYLQTWDDHSKEPFYQPYKNLLLEALQKFESGDAIPMLSTPTHQPAWICPVTLVERMHLYQQASRPYYNTDYQVAVSRCRLTDTAVAATMAAEVLSGEHKNMMQFLFGVHKTPEGPFNNTAVWMCCSLALREKKTYPAFADFLYYKRPFEIYSGQLQWQSVVEEIEAKKYDYILAKYVSTMETQKLLKVYVPVNRGGQESTGLKKFFSSFLPKKPVQEQPLIYDDFKIKADWFSAENDIQRILLLVPNNPEALLAEIAKRCLKYSTFWSESDKKLLIAVLQTLYEIWDDFGEMAYLFLGTCMILSDKTVVNIAGEIWVKGVGLGKMNSQQLGTIIGRHESIEFAPLKRLTDLISQNLFRISSLHNQHLKVMIEQILVALSDVPIKNLKKLLEIYVELLSADKEPLKNEKLIMKLTAWKENSGLQKIVERILILN